MDLTTTVVIAHGSQDERRRLAQSLNQLGVAVLSVSNGEEALRTTVGSNPHVVVTHSGLPEVPGAELRTRLAATGLEIPPILVIVDGPEGPPLDPPDGVYFVSPAELEQQELAVFVQRILIGQELHGEFADDLGVLYGDLARSSFGDLVQILARHGVTGCLEIASQVPSGVWLRDGSIVDAWHGGIVGIKAFHRLADLQAAAWSLTAADPGDRDRITADSATLVLEAVDERVAVHEALQRLPSLDARPRVQIGRDLFQLEFSPVERQVMATVQKVTTLTELVDRVTATDREVFEAVLRLRELGILSLVEPAGRVHVLTDSTADLTGLDARRHGVEIVPVSIVFGSDVFMDGIDITPDEFHRRLAQSRDLPVTNPATRGEFLAVYRRVVPTGDVLAVLCSSKLSGSFANAGEAAEEGLEELRELRRQRQVQAEPVVRIVDSLQCSGPLGLMAVFAARLLKRGASLDETARRIEGIGGRFRTMLALASPEYLRSGRRIQLPAGTDRADRTTRWLLRLEDGELKLVETVRGVEAARERLLELAAEGVAPDRPVFAAVVHASEPAQAAALRARVEARLQIAELTQHPIGPAVTCNTGPGAIGVALFQPTPDELELLSE